MAQNLYPTPYTDVNAVLCLLLEQVRQALDQDFVGLYVHGSLASGDFDPQRSDIDFLVVTRGELSAMQLALLGAMHAGIRSSDVKWANRLEGSYIPRSAIRRHDSAHMQHPALNIDGSFGVDTHGSDWVVQRHILRERGIIVAGPPLQELIEPVKAEDLRKGVAGILQEWWSEPLPSPERFESHEYRAYAVLTMCRALYTLTCGTVESKPRAAAWVKRVYGEKWHGLIDQALAWRPGLMAGGMDETFQFLRFTVEQSSMPGHNRRSC